MEECCYVKTQFFKLSSWAEITNCQKGDQKLNKNTTLYVLIFEAKMEDFAVTQSPFPTPLQSSAGERRYVDKNLQKSAQILRRVN